jgi:hypothetical protein
MVAGFFRAERFQECKWQQEMVPRIRLNGFADTAALYIFSYPWSSVGGAMAQGQTPPVAIPAEMLVFPLARFLSAVQCYAAFASALNYWSCGQPLCKLQH